MTALEPINVPQAAKLLVRDFMLLCEAGTFADYAKSELIDGEIFCMNAIWAAHARIQSRLSRACWKGVDEAGLGLEVFSPVSIQLDESSMPEPDVILAEDHRSGPVPAAKIRLIIEVSDSTLETDLGRKAALYARHGVAEYWVVDIEGKRIIQMWQPSGEAYAEQREVAFGDVVRAATLAGLVVETRGLV